MNDGMAISSLLSTVLNTIEDTRELKVKPLLTKIYFQPY